MRLIAVCVLVIRAGLDDNAPASYRKGFDSVTRILCMVLAAFALGLGSMTVSVPAFAAGDAAKGKKVFNKCRACHKLVAGKRAVGPTLHAMFGRKAGTLEGFKYSKDMAAAGAKGLVWTEETFVAYMADPKRYIGSYIGKKKARTRMAFAGLKKKKDRENLLVYLKEATK